VLHFSSLYQREWHCCNHAIFTADVMSTALCFFSLTVLTVLRVASVCRHLYSQSMTLCIVAKRCVLEQKLLLTASRKSYMRNRLVPKWMTLTFV